MSELNPKHGGPEKCPKGECSECVGRAHHHWCMTVVSPFEEEPTAAEREMVAHGVVCAYTCKHCDAWVELIDDDDGEEMDPDYLWEAAYSGRKAQ